ncbi:N-acetylglucosamine kinase [Streptomyces monticola]|uniref:N-acetylglucosamine kinase n=1 Tax=Streptomyces monticola TaxID=2666263 RepID=A0ABW2JEQ5_9ACTN
MAAAVTHSWVLGVDSGGSGLRVALAPAPAGSSVHAPPTAGRVPAGQASDRRAPDEKVPDEQVPAEQEPFAGAPGGSRTAGSVSSREPVRTGPDGIDAGHLMDQLAPMAGELLEAAGSGAVVAVAVGAAGMATLGGDLRARLPGALDEAFGVRRLALAADGVTAYAGALGQRPGAVVAAGTGMIALGTDLREWRRADGWGHLLGDCGGGAWIGRAGLEAAMRAHDGRRGGSPVLLARAEEVFGGPVTELPGKLYPRTDRPAALASFAPAVGECAGHDPVAAGILRDAGARIAEAAAAVCPAGTACEVALTGGLFKMGDPLLVPLKEELARQLPTVRAVSAVGDPLDGALAIAAALADDTLRLPHDNRLLHLPDSDGRR